LASPSRRRSSTDSPTYLVEIFVISAAALLLEISYTRVISFKLYYYYTYLVIGLALLGLGSGAVIVAVSKHLDRLSTRALLARCCLAAAAGIVLGYVTIAITPLDTLAIWTGSTPLQAVAVGQLLLVCLGLYISFLPIGMCIAALFARRPDDINRLYFSDLAGAALACLVVVPLVAFVGPVSIITGVAVGLLVLGVHLSSPAPRTLLTGSVIVGVLLVAVAISPGLAPDIRTEESKGVRPGTPLAASEWSALFRVDALDLPLNTVLFHDGIWGSAIWPWDGDPLSLDRFDSDDRSIPFAALGERPERVLIIGAAGGNEIAASIHFGAEQIDAVELNPATAGLLRGQYAEYSGNLTEAAGVNYVVGDGRSYLARSDDSYDLVWFVAPDSYAASNAASSGAFVLSESYLYTQEMLQESLQHLSDDGMVVMQFGEKDYENRPNRTARLAATAREAFGAEGIGPFDDHVAVVTSSAEGFLYGVSTTMMKADPFTVGELDRIEAQVAAVADARVRYLPGRLGDDDAPVNQIISLPDAQVGAYIDTYPFDVSAISDNRPFFWHFTPFSQVIGELGSPVEDVDVEIGIGERVLLVLLGVSILLAAVFLLVPFVLVRDTWSELPDKATSAPIFALLGLAFIAFEIVLIQRFSLFLGYPTYSLTVTLMAILLATGVGALVSERWHGRPRRMLGSLAVAILALGAFYTWLTPLLEEALIGWPLLAKAGLVIVLCAPLGFCLGMFMPFAISLVARDHRHQREYVAWGWAINGFFSVIGSTLTTMVSMTFGFRTVLVASVMAYLVVIALLHRLVGREPIDSGEPVDSGQPIDSGRPVDRGQPIETGTEPGEPVPAAV
jgi:spermidine synthase